MDGLYGKLTMGEGARLVEHHRLDLRQNVHIVGSLDEDASTRGTTDAPKEREGHADNQGARTTHHEEHQGAIEPSGESG